MTRSKRTRALLISVVVMLATAAIALADPPSLIRYQARLTDATGTPLTGAHTLIFRLYDRDTGGTLLWSEGPTSIDLGSGSVDFLLGTVTPLTSNLLLSPDRWLEVTVDGAILSPRQRLSSVPFALAADRLGTQTLSQIEAGVDADIAAHAALANPHPVYVSKAGDTMTGNLFFSPSGSSTTVQSTGTLFLVAAGQALGAIEIHPANFTAFRQSNGRFFFHEGTGAARFTVDAAAGRVGVGTTVPKEALDVVGNATISGNLMSGGLGFNTAQTRYLNVPPSAFQPRDPGMDTWRLDASGGAIRQKTGVLTGSVLFAPLHLPDGANITGFTAHLSDNNLTAGENIRVSLLWLSNLNSVPFQTLHGAVNSDSVQPTNGIVAVGSPTPAGFTVNNQTSSMFLVLELNGSTGTPFLTNVVIPYTISRL